MTNKTLKWNTEDFSKAMQNAIYQNANKRFTRKENDTLKFNGFWRKGDKQNVCAWLNTASWHDAKTGEGGNCKEFASIAFDMSLPEFMDRYGQVFYQQPMQNFFTPPKIPISKPINEIWIELQQRDLYRHNKAHEWLINERGFKQEKFGSGVCNLDLSDIALFDSQHHSLIKYRVSLGPQLVAPIRGVHSEKVQNLFIRAISNVPKEEKSRLLTDCGGWSEPDGSPRAFGFPHLVNDFPNIILCEGMADYFAAEYLLGDEYRYLPIGAASASALPKWAQYLTDMKYTGRVILIYQLDVDENNRVAASQIGQINATNAAKILRTAGIKSELFNWVLFLKRIPGLRTIPRDLADICSSKENKNNLSDIFTRFISGTSK